MKKKTDIKKMANEVGVTVSELNSLMSEVPDKLRSYTYQGIATRIGQRKPKQKADNYGFDKVIAISIKRLKAQGASVTWRTIWRFLENYLPTNVVKGEVDYELDIYHDRHKPFLFQVDGDGRERFMSQKTFRNYLSKVHPKKSK